MQRTVREGAPLLVSINASVPQVHLYKRNKMKRKNAFAPVFILPAYKGVFVTAVNCAVKLGTNACFLNDLDAWWLRNRKRFAMGRGRCLRRHELGHLKCVSRFLTSLVTH